MVLQILLLLCLCVCVCGFCLFFRRCNWPTSHCSYMNCSPHITQCSPSFLKGSSFGQISRTKPWETGTSVFPFSGNLVQTLWAALFLQLLETLIAVSAVILMGVFRPIVLSETWLNSVTLTFPQMVTMVTIYINLNQL